MNEAVLDRFEWWVRECPEAIAVVVGGQRLTYSELNVRADRLARYLTGLGVGPEVIVGVLLGRSIDLIPTLLAVWKAGGAYLPIDPEYPEEYIQHILKISNVGFILTTGSEINRFSYSQLLDLNRNPIEVIKTPERAPLEFNSLPIPDRSLVKYQKYAPFEKMSFFKDTIAIQCTRGCPYNCLFCHKIWPKKHSFRSAESIFEEIRINYESGIRKFSIVDDIFNLNVKNSSKVFELIIKNKMDLQISFGNGIRGDILTSDYIDLMVEAGVRHISFALESASPRLQKVLKKNLDIEKMRANIQYTVTRYPEVLVDLFTLHGIPTETEQEALMTLDYIKSIEWLNTPYIFVLKIYPNSEMYDFAIANGISKEAIERSLNLAYHELPETLPWDKSFTKNYQNQFLQDYYLKKDRLVKMLPLESKVTTEQELVNQYNLYLGNKFETFDQLLKYLKIDSSELRGIAFEEPNSDIWDQYDQKISQYFPKYIMNTSAIRILLLDLSQEFTDESFRHHNVIVAPLGMMYLLSYLNRELAGKINGKIGKSRIDFDNFEEFHDFLDSFKPDIIGIRTLSHNRDFFHHSVGLIRQWGITVPIIVGGPYATSSYQSLCLDQNIDIVVCGEGEATFKELIKAILDNNGSIPSKEILKDIEGIAFRGDEENKLSKRQIIQLDQLMLADADIVENTSLCKRSAHDLAYSIFTSGSTGLPKRVLIEQHSLARLVDVWEKFYELKEFTPVILQTASMAFDMFTGDMLKALCFGGKLVIVSELEKKSIPKIAELIQQEKITNIEAVPSYIKMLADYVVASNIDYSALKQIVLGGEECGKELYVWLMSQFRSDCRVINGYGLTEASIESIVFEGKNIELNNLGHLPIGIPFNGVSVFILNKKLEPVPDGDVGEIMIGGWGIARGYLNDPEYTSEKFINIFCNGTNERVYRTGDLGRKLRDGNIEYIGRIDQQVQIQGHRVDCFQLQEYLNSLINVSESLVVGKLNDKERVCIVAYLILEDLAELDDIKNAVEQNFPKYMKPQYYVLVKDFPKTPNGKINREALPNPNWNSVKTSLFVPPETELEMQTAHIWQTVLKREKIGITDDFFELGGDSLDSIKIVSEMNLIGLDVSVQDLYYHRCIKQLLGQYSKESDSVYLTSLNNSRDKENGGLVDEDELQIVNAILKNFRKTEISFLNKMLTTSIQAKYCHPSHQYTLRTMYRDVYFAEFIDLKPGYDLSEVGFAVKEIIQEQSLLRSVLSVEDSVYSFIEYKGSETITIPVVDIQNLSVAARGAFIQEILKKYYQKEDRLKNFLCRFLILQIDKHQSVLCILMDESIHDRQGMYIFRQRFEEITQAKKQSKRFQVVPFYQYLQILSDGPSKISDSEIIDFFDLRLFSKAATEMGDYFNSFDAKHLLTYKFQYQNSTQGSFVEPWAYSLRLMWEFFKKFVSLSDVPVLVVYDSRAYNNYAFSNTIGDFIDFVPVLADLTLSFESFLNKVNRSLEKAVNHQINFVNLHFDKDRKEFEKTKSLLNDAVGDLMDSKSFFIFHYQSQMDNSFEVYDYENGKEYLNPWLKGFYLLVNFCRGDVDIRLNVPFKHSRKSYELFFKKIIKEI